MPIPLRAFSSTPHRRTGGPEGHKLKADGSCSCAAHRIAAGRVAPALVHKAKAEEKDDVVVWRVLDSGREA